ncbi:phosphodiester glycosidase family protein [Streptomyces plicatus]|nr:phosphodiester glycosidase family protein [Streptomyces plicatus]
MADARTGAVLAAALCVVLAGCDAAGTPDRSERATGAPSAPPATGAELPAGVRYQEFTRYLGAGRPVRLHVLRVAPDARARVTAVHGAAMNRADTVSSLARRTGALVAFNGTYFDVRADRDGRGHDGDPIGLYAEQGKVLSEAVSGRPALLLGREHGRLTARVAEASTDVRLRAADGAGRELDGVNRVAGRDPGCRAGGRTAGGAGPVARPSGGGCAEGDEVVQFTTEWGTRTPPGPADSTEVVLAADGTALRTRSPAGGPVPADGWSLYGVGRGAAWLRAHVPPGTRPVVTERVTVPPGRTPLGTIGTALGGSARLLRAGVVDADAARLRAEAEPRTVAGVTADGTLLLLAVDGRAQKESVGATPTEAARLARSLGAVDAVNLDGGGSTTVAVAGHLRNAPRGTENGPVTERRVANAIVVLPE